VLFNTSEKGNESYKKAESAIRDRKNNSLTREKYFPN
jgi:hypothetical protein